MDITLIKDLGRRLYLNYQKWTWKTIITVLIGLYGDCKRGNYVKKRNYLFSLIMKKKRDYIGNPKKYKKTELFRKQLGLSFPINL